MNRKLAIGVAIIPVGILAVWAIFFRDGPDASQIIRIGTILVRTGEGGPYGQRMQRGFELAVEDANASGGIRGKKVELVIEDTEFDAAKAVTAYRKLTGAQGITIIVGITGSKNALPICESAKSDDVVIVDALSSAPKLTTHGGPTYFRVMASDALAGRYNAEWAMKSGMKKPAILYVEDDFGVSYRDSLIAYLKKLGFESPPVYGVIPGTRDFRTEIEKIKPQNPDAIFLLVYAKEGAGFMQQARQGGIKATVYGSDNLSSPEFVAAGADVVEGARVALPATAGGKLYDDFGNAYRKKYNEEPDAIVIKSYDAMRVTLAAIQAVGESPSLIRDHLRSPAFVYAGVSGKIQFDAHGDLTSQEYTKMEYKDGKLVSMEKKSAQRSLAPRPGTNENVGGALNGHNSIWDHGWSGVRTVLLRGPPIL